MTPLILIIIALLLGIYFSIIEYNKKQEKINLYKQTQIILA